MKITNFLLTTYLIIITAFTARVATQNALRLVKIENKDVSMWISEDKLWITVQEWRVKNGKSLYQKDQRMCDLAEIRAEEIKENFDHNDWYSKLSGMEYKELAENLVKGYENEQEALEAWLASPGHKENLEGNYAKSCIKCSENHCAQEFINY